MLLYHAADNTGESLNCVSRWEGKGKQEESTRQGHQEILGDVVCRQDPGFLDKRCLFPDSASFLRQVFCT